MRCSETQIGETQKSYDEYDCISKYISNKEPEEFVDTIVLSDSEDVIIDWFAVCDDSADEDDNNSQYKSPEKDEVHETTVTTSPVEFQYLSPSSPKLTETRAQLEQNCERHEVSDENYEQQVQLNFDKNWENNLPHLSSKHTDVRHGSQRELEPKSISSEENCENTSPYMDSSPMKRKQPTKNIGGISLKFTKKQQNKEKKPESPKTLEFGTKYLPTAIAPPKQRKQLKKIDKTQKKVTPRVPKLKKTTPTLPSEFTPTKEYVCMECASAFITERARDTHYNRYHLGTTANAWTCMEQQKRKNYEASKKLAIKKEIYQEGVFREYDSHQSEIDVESNNPEINNQLISHNQTQLINEFIPHYSSPQLVSFPPLRNNHTSNNYAPQPQPAPYSSEQQRSSYQLSHNIQLSLQLKASHGESGINSPNNNFVNKPPQYQQPQLPSINDYQPYNYTCQQQTVQPMQCYPNMPEQAPPEYGQYN